MKKSPKVEKYFLQSVKDELFALLLFCRDQWYVVAMIVMVIALAIYFVSPLPPSKIRVASGQTNSTLEKIAFEYARYFEEHGVEIEFVTTRGASDNLLALKNGRVDVAFSQGGLPVAKEDRIVSLGSIGYQPLWYFHTGPAFEGSDFVKFLEGKTISIALPGSGTRPVADALIETLPRASRNEMRFVEMSARASIDNLVNGSIDGMFFLAGVESGNAQELLQRPDVSILHFPVAPALTKYIDYTEVVRLPKGALGLSPPRPALDVDMIATTTTILVRESLHPAIQYLFMRASTESYRSEEVFFERAGGFPAFTEKHIPRSEIAQRYYTNGPPILEGYAPYWVVSFFDLAWFTILALIAVLYPMMRMVPGYRKIMFDIGASYKYGEIFKLSSAVDRGRSAEQLAELRQSYERIKQEVEELWIPKGCFQSYYFLLGALEIIEEKLLIAEHRLSGDRASVLR